MTLQTLFIYIYIYINNNKYLLCFMSYCHFLYIYIRDACRRSIINKALSLSLVVEPWQLFLKTIEQILYIYMY